MMDKDEINEMKKRNGELEDFLSLTEEYVNEMWILIDDETFKKIYPNIHSKMDKFIGELHKVLE